MIVRVSLMFVFLLSVVMSVSGYKVFTYSRAEIDETNRSMKIDKPYICGSNSSTEIDLLIIVNSAVGNFAKRSAIRDTWGKVVREQTVPMLFLLGSTPNAHLQSRVEAEDKQFGDLVQASVMDNYRNLTLKTMVMLRFISLNCPQTKWVLKLDDDMLLHAQRIINFARTTNCTGTMFGRLGNTTPIRNSTHKNHCPVECYPNAKYPDFLTGGTVLLEGKQAQSMYNYVMTNYSTVSVVEDMFMYGIVAQALNISRIGFYGLDYDFSEYERIFPNDVCAFTKHFSTEQVYVERFRDLWQKFNKVGEATCQTMPELNQLTKCNL